MSVTRAKPTLHHWLAVQLLSLDAPKKPRSLARAAYEGNRVLAPTAACGPSLRPAKAICAWLEASGWSASVFAKRGFAR